MIVWGMRTEFVVFILNAFLLHHHRTGTVMIHLKRVLLRTMPELAGELQSVVNVFDPWARDRGEYYSLECKARHGAESDESFEKH